MAGAAGAFQPGALGAFPGSAVNGLMPAAGGGGTRGDGKGHNIEVTPVEVRAMAVPQKPAVLAIITRKQDRVGKAPQRCNAKFRLTSVRIEILLSVIILEDKLICTLLRVQTDHIQKAICV